MLDYLLHCGVTAEGRDCDVDTEFALLALDANMEGDEVDYVNKIVLDLTFINNQKVKCVYDKLKNLSNTIFNDIVNDNFSSSKVARVKFTIDNIITGEDAQTRPSYGGGTFSTHNIVLNTTFVQNATLIEIAHALIHEIIHAEIAERCIRLGLVSSITFNPSTGNVNVLFNSSPITFTLQSIIFNQFINEYISYADPSEWNHNMFNGLNYRTSLSQNMLSIHPLLNDTGNDFLTNINTDPLAIDAPYTIEQVMDYMSWIALESTQEFTDSILSIPMELAKKNYIEDSSKTKYTDICIN